MFAGPNGSGKSTMKALLRPELLARYINPDEIEAEIRGRAVFNLSFWDVQTDESEIAEFFARSTLLARAGLLDAATRLRLVNGQLLFSDVEVNSYFASVVADFVRQKLLIARRSFTFETVMSSPDKPELLRRAQEAGFRTYLYFVATDDPEINISRVASRVRAGGHDVPTDKIVARYTRSLELLTGAIQSADRAYLFDNSGPRLDFLAEFQGGQLLEIKTDLPPRWFETYVLERLAS